MPVPQASLSADELQFLDEAALYLERPSFLIRIADFVGQPAERLLKLLPQRAHALVSQIAQAALEKAFGVAVRSLSSRRWPIVGPWRPAAGRRLHVALTAISGGAGGLFGWPGAAVEIPITTTLMMRSIAEIARQSGSNLNDPETLMQCLAVFSYGSPKMEAMESAFLSWRVAMATAVSEAAAYIALHGAGGAAHSAAPVLVRFLNSIATRFQIVISDKLAAEAVPVAGAVTGSLINAAFTDHFNRVAEFHFGILRLERLHGAEAVQAAYRQAAERAGRQPQKKALQ
jgi:EcsC protein family